MADEAQVPTQPQPQIVYVQAPSGAMTFTVAQLLPWFLLSLVLIFFVGRGWGNNSPAPAPTPVPGPTPVVPVAETIVEKLDKILTEEEGLYLSAVCRNISLLVAKDGENSNKLFTSTKDIQKLVSSSGTVVTLDHGPYPGLGELLATYFDEESEFPQKVGDLTVEYRAKAVANWQKISEDLAKVK